MLKYLLCVFLSLGVLENFSASSKKAFFDNNLVFFLGGGVVFFGVLCFLGGLSSCSFFSFSSSSSYYYSLSIFHLLFSPSSFSCLPFLCFAIFISFPTVSSLLSCFGTSLFQIPSSNLPFSISICRAFFLLFSCVWFMFVFLKHFLVQVMVCNITIL